MTDMLSIQDYCTQTGTSERTVRRWLSAGELPGATKVKLKNVAGQPAWMIPADAVRTVPEDPEMAAVLAMPTQRTGGAVAVSQPPALFVSVDEFVALSGLTDHAVRGMIHDGELTAYRRGPNGAYVIPVREVRWLAGLL